MKKTIFFLLSFSTFCYQLHAGDGFSEAKMNVECAYEAGTGAHEAANASVSASMLGWGIGLAAGIAILTGILHQSKGTAH